MLEVTRQHARRPTGRVPARGRPRRGEQPAGQILVTMLVALCLAALINADALVERAEDKPIGAGRDRSLYLWHPVQDIANFSQLSRLRGWADDLVGNQDQGGDVVTEPSEPAPADVKPPVLRSPSASAPLRLYIAGDSILRDAAESLLQLSADDPVLESTLHYEIASGLTRPDFFDWPRAIREDTTAQDPEITILMFGGNDAQGIVTADGTVFQHVADAGWQAEYGRRVGLVMDDQRSTHRLLLWVGLPPMRDAGFNGRAQIMNRIYREQAESRPWVEYVDTFPVLGDANGEYVERLPGPDGDLIDLRQDDGAHLSRGGADRLASHLLDLIAKEIAAVEVTTTTR